MLYSFRIEINYPCWQPQRCTAEGHEPWRESCQSGDCAPTFQTSFQELTEKLDELVEWSVIDRTIEDYTVGTEGEYSHLAMDAVVPTEHPWYAHHVGVWHGRDVSEATFEEIVNSLGLHPTERLPEREHIEDGALGLLPVIGFAVDEHNAISNVEVLSQPEGTDEFFPEAYGLAVLHETAREGGLEAPESTPLDVITEAVFKRWLP